MLADPRHSRVVLINRTCGETSALSAGLAACRASLALLRAGLEVFAIPSILVGEREPFWDGSAEQRVVQLDVDVLSIWQDQPFADALASAETRILFLGGGWLEEEIFIAALQGAQDRKSTRLNSSHPSISY